MMKQLAICLVGALAAVGLSSRPAKAVLVVASDDASQAAYSDGWVVGDNGGTGFAAWSTINNSGGGSGGGFLADMSGDSQINTSGKAFGIFGNGGGVGQAIRSFSSALNVTDTISLAMDNGFVDSGGTVGFGLQNSSGTNLFEFFFVGGTSEYRVNRAGGVVDTGVGFTNAGLQLSFMLTDADTFTFSIDRLTDGLGTNVATVTGDLLTAGGISRMRLFNANAGFNDDHNAFFNSFEVTAVPEASAFLCFGAVGVVAGLLWRLRKRSGRRQAA